jgi:hypothetical protein
MLEEKDLSNWRARRLHTCRLADDLMKIIEYLGVDDGSVEKGKGAPTPAVKQELRNQCTVLMRTILAHNDGGCAPADLQRF